MSYVEWFWVIMGVLIFWQLGSLTYNAQRILSELVALRIEITSMSIDIQALRQRHAPERTDYRPD